MDLLPVGIGLVGSVWTIRQLPGCEDSECSAFGLLGMYVVDFYAFFLTTVIVIAAAIGRLAPQGIAAYYPDGELERLRLQSADFQRTYWT